MTTKIKTQPLKENHSNRKKKHNKIKMPHQIGKTQLYGCVHTLLSALIMDTNTQRSIRLFTAHKYKGVTTNSNDNVKG